MFGRNRPHAETFCYLTRSRGAGVEPLEAEAWIWICIWPNYFTEAPKRQSSQEPPPPWAGVHKMAPAELSCWPPCSFPSLPTRGTQPHSTQGAHTRPQLCSPPPDAEHRTAAAPSPGSPGSGPQACATTKQDNFFQWGSVALK